MSDIETFYMTVNLLGILALAGMFYITEGKTWRSRLRMFLSELSNARLERTSSIGSGRDSPPIVPNAEDPS
jgi:hypothetical protein